MTLAPPPDRLTITDPDELAITTIRTLCMDAVQAANSGHPGTPMALAPVAYVLWQKFLRFDPEETIWANRDRFVLSAGHASTLLYSMLHLTRTKAVSSEYETLGRATVTLDDLRTFRQLDSRCPGHPEYRWTSGVETTTGPLGSGLATSVGMAISSKWQGAHFNRPGYEVFDFDVYALAGDGCMMEGVASEAASLAGHLELDNLCWIWDNNHITIEGNTSLAFTEDVATRFIAYGWNVTRVGDANDLDMLTRAFDVFKKERGRPTLIIVDSHIGYGAPTKQDTSAAHGEPLGDTEIRLTKEFYGWPPDETFLVPDSVYETFDNGIGRRGRQARTDWYAMLAEYEKAHPQQYGELAQMLTRRLPDGWDADLPVFEPDDAGIASRISNGTVLNAVAATVPWLVGGAADLAPSTKTMITDPEAGNFSAENRSGRNFNFGVREHAATSIANGMSLCKLRSYEAGFLIFSDYARGAIRLSALMEIPVLHIFTHDSIGVGEDGPTHQPVEHLASIRAMPGMCDFRPGDANEVTEMWRTVMQFRHEPTAMFLSRQNLRTLDRSRFAPAAGVARGGYVLADPPDGEPEAIIIASGSELQLAVAAFEQLTAEGVRVRVVSLPSWFLFDEESREYQEEVLPPSVQARVAVEQASTFGWERYVGSNGSVVGMDTFGASAPLKHLQTKFGFTPDAVVQRVRDQIALHGR